MEADNEEILKHMNTSFHESIRQGIGDTRLHLVLKPRLGSERQAYAMLLLELLLRTSLDVSLSRDGGVILMSLSVLCVSPKIQN